MKVGNPFRFSNLLSVIHTMHVPMSDSGIRDRLCFDINTVRYAFTRRTVLYSP